jgi:low temperature requirement protein LtrA
VVWSAWLTTTWVTNWFDPDQLSVRLMLVWVMLASLFMSVAIPDAFGERGFIFGAAVAAVHVVRAAFAFVSLRTSMGPAYPLTRTFQRALGWHVGAAVFWVAGGAVDGRPRFLLWGLAVVMNYVAPAVGYYIPGLGAARTTEWPIHALHFAERCRLFIIIALGESLLVTGATFGEDLVTPTTTAAFLVAFTTSVALWWIYFHRSAEAAGQVLGATADPGGLARSAYSFLHLPIVAGIIAVAAGDEFVVSHPSEHGTPTSVALTLGGAALFLIGHAWFKYAVFGRLPWAHIIAVVALGVLVPIGPATSTLLISGAAGVVLVGLAAWETLAPHRRAAT